MHGVEDQLGFGPLLKRYRLAAGLTQQELADRAGLGIRTIQLLERGANTPQRETLGRLLRALAVPDAVHASWEATLNRRRGPADGGREGPRTGRNPYKGLRAFTAADAGDFFGRDRLVDALLARLADQVERGPRLLAVIGPSGSGKSSLLLAGVLPRLRAGALPASAGWCYLPPLTPGAQPLEALALVLATALPDRSLVSLRADLGHSARGLHLLASRVALGGPARVALLVDQFEELFTLSADETERRQFVDLLVTAATEPGGRALVLLTLRADFYDRPLQYPALGALLDTQGMAVLPLSPEELRAAIERPAALPDVRLTFEAGLVDEVLADLHGQIGALPLLQFTLDALVSRCDGRVLARAAYRELGGVRGALARRAEATYAALPDEEQRQLARALFLRLIALGTSEQETARRRVSALELLLPDPRQTALLHAVIGAFVTARLLVATSALGVDGPGPGPATLEVSHEALIREWGRLGEWLRSARDDVFRQQAISADAAEWARRGQPVDHLYRGTLLDEANAWAARNAPSAAEQHFLQAATAERERQAALERERQRRELQTQRQAAGRLRLLVGVLALFLLVAAGLTTVAVDKAIIANNNAAAAEAGRALSLSRQLAAQAINHLEDHYDLALLLSVEAMRSANTVEARDSLLRGLEHNLRLVAFLHGNGSAVTSLAASPDGKTLAAGSQDGSMHFWDVLHRHPLGRPIPTHPGIVTGVAFSRDGRSVISSGFDGTLRLWAVARRTALGPPFAGQPFAGRLYHSYNVAMGPGGETLASGSDNNSVLVWDLAHRRLLGPPLANPNGDAMGGVPIIAFSPDGKTLATATWTGDVVLWDLADRKAFDLNTRGQAGAVTSLTFSPNGKILALGVEDQTIQLWDVARRQPLGGPLSVPTRSRFSAQSGSGLSSLVFSPDSETLLSGSRDGTIQLWDVARGRGLGPPLTAHDGGVTSLSFIPRSWMLAAGSDNGDILLWDMAPEHSLATVLIDHTGGGSMAYSPDGTTLAIAGANGSIQLRDLARPSARGMPRTGDRGAVTSLTFSADGRQLAAGGADGAILLWEVGSRRALGRALTGHTDRVTSLAFSPDGRILASGSDDRTIRLWDVARGRPLGRPLSGHTLSVTTVAFSPDGKILVSGSYDGTTQLWSVATQQPLGHPLGHTDPVLSVAYSPGGTILASASADGSLRLFDTATAQLLGPPLSQASAVTSLAFSADGASLASGSEDGTIQLWDVSFLQPLGQPLLGHRGTVTGLAFSPDGKALISGSVDGTIRRWDVDSGSWQRRACGIAARNLTPKEWRRYLGDQPYHRTCPDFP